VFFSLACFNAQADAVMNCCVVALSVVSSDILSWSSVAFGFSL